MILLFSFLCRSQRGETPQREVGAGTPRHDMEERPRSEAPRARDPRL